MAERYLSDGEKILAHTQKEVARLFGVDLGLIQSREEFTVEPEVDQKLQMKLMQYDPFLKLIHSEQVKAMSGRKVTMSITETVSGRTPRRGPRKPVDKLKLAQDEYMLSYIERDVEMDWLKVDTWAGRHSTFFSKFMQMCAKRRSQDMIITAWNGQFIAPETDAEKHTKLQDANIGFIQYMIQVAPEKVLGYNPDGSVDPIRVGKGGDFENMHEMVHFMGETLIDPIHRDRTDIKCVTGREVISDRKGKLFARWGGEEEPTEQNVLDTVIHQNDYADRTIQRSAFAPQRLVFLSPMDNFSRYTLKGKTRVKPVYNDHDTKALKDLMYLYESFQMEDLDCCAMVHPDAIQLRDREGNWVSQVPENRWAIDDEEGNPLVINDHEDDSAEEAAE